MVMRRITCSLVLVAALAAAAASSDGSFDGAGFRIALKVYEDCAKSDFGFTPCLKKKAYTFLDRLGRMDKLNLVDGVSIVRGPDTPTPEPAVSEEQLENTLPRAADARDQALDGMLMDKVSSLVSSRTLQISLPKLTAEETTDVEEGRKKKMKGMGMMGGMMMGMAAKMAAMVPIAIGGLFLLAGKALITAKIALLISGIIALKKLLGSKGGGGGGGHGGGGWQSGGGGGGGGWQSSGGGWDKRSLNEAQKIAYKAYSA